MQSIQVRNLIVAAGGIVLRGNEVLLVHRPRYDDWSFPKGKLDDGESPLQAAVREVREETGYRVKVTGFAGAAGYLVGKHPKVVLFWTMEAVKAGKIQDTGEVAAIEWLPFGKARRRLTYGMEKELLAKVVAARESGSKIVRGRP